MREQIFGHVFDDLWMGRPERILLFVNRKLPDRFQADTIIPQTDMAQAVGLIGQVNRYRACDRLGTTEQVMVTERFRLDLPHSSDGPSHRIFLWQTVQSHTSVIKRRGY